MPIKLRVLGNDGTNISSQSLWVGAVEVVQVSTQAPGTLVTSGAANPDNQFRYDPALQGYIYNLSTRSLTTGTYQLRFTVGGDLSDLFGPIPSEISPRRSTKAAKAGTTEAMVAELS